MAAYDHELSIATTLCRQSGELLVRYFGQLRQLKVERKAGDEPVTEADRASQALIVDGLRQAFPNDGILAEEQGDRCSWRAHRRAWLVDPLDGTKDFIAGREGFSVMIGLLVDRRPVLGVVHQPLAELTYRATRGGGAQLLRGEQCEPLRPSSISDPAQARLVASYSHRTTRLEEVKSELGITDELAVGSVGLKVGLVARGDRDLYVNTEGHCRLWDICAPEAILVEAGGKMTNLAGEPLVYGEEIRVLGGIVASNGACHDAVIEKIAPLIAPQ